MTAEFKSIFWPVFAAMVASGTCFEVIHFGLGLFISWRHAKRTQLMKERIAAQLGVDPSQLDMIDYPYGEGSFPSVGGNFSSQIMGNFPPTTSGNAESKNGHGQYL